MNNDEHCSYLLQFNADDVIGKTRGQKEFSSSSSSELKSIFLGLLGFIIDLRAHWQLISQTMIELNQKLTEMQGCASAAALRER